MRYLGGWGWALVPHSLTLGHFVRFTGLGSSKQVGLGFLLVWLAVVWNGLLGWCPTMVTSLFLFFLFPVPPDKYCIKFCNIVQSDVLFVVVVVRYFKSICSISFKRVEVS